MYPIRRTILMAVVAAMVLWSRSVAIFSRGSISTAPATSLEKQLQDVERGYKLEVVTEMPETITALIASTDRSPELFAKVFVGTSPVGAVYSFNLMTPNSRVIVGEGLGDYTRFGLCDVNSLAINDIDKDGISELFATTSQIVPRGRPRLYVWSLSCPIVPRSMIRPNILSSWSHGLGFVETAGGASLGTYVTFCGYGEIVEYQFARATSDVGFVEETLGWKQVGRLPVSGEGLQSIDIDQDGQTEICVATGFMPGKAAIHVYRSDRVGADLELEQILDESREFANVRFLAGDTRGDGIPDLVAWWCESLQGGDSKVVRYRLGPEGVRERTVLAEGTGNLYWPMDGQMAIMDLDRDGHPEIWFSNTAGGLWRYDESRSPAMKRIAQIKGAFGPIAPAPATPQNPPALLVAMGRSVLRLVVEPVPTPAFPRMSIRAE